MFIPYEEICDDAKIWIYQSDKILNNQIQSKLESILFSFCTQWSSHNITLKSSYYVDSWFICLLVDETQKDASGCSIDSSVKIIKQIEDQFNLNLQLTGMCNDFDASALRGSNVDEGIIYFFLKNRKIIGACGVGVGGKIGRDIRLAGKLSENKTKVTKEILIDKNIKLNKILKN